MGKIADLKDEMRDQSPGRAGRGSERVKGHTLHRRAPGRLAQEARVMVVSLHPLLGPVPEHWLILGSTHSCLGGSRLKAECKRQTVSAIPQ